MKNKWYYHKTVLVKLRWMVSQRGCLVLLWLLFYCSVINFLNVTIDMLYTVYCTYIFLNTQIYQPYLNTKSIYTHVILKHILVFKGDK